VPRKLVGEGSGLTAAAEAAVSRILWPLRAGWQNMVERFIQAVRSDFGCLVIIVAFVVIMISTIVFANIITPPSNNPFV
jgi:cytochrome b561